VLTPETGRTDMSKVIEQRALKPTLVILPKWRTVADTEHSGWVRYRGLQPTFEPEGVLAPKNDLKIARHPSGGRPLVGLSWMPADVHFAAPRPLQTMAGADLKPLITDDQGGIVLGQIGEHPFYVLADPDLLSNIAMRDPKQARSALALLDFLNATGAKSVLFDVTLNGFGRSRTPLKLAFEPPFLAMTLAVAAAVLLAGIQATARFGAPRRRERAIAFGKTALIDNAAALVRKARRQGALGARYVDLVRERAVGVFGVPARLRTVLDVFGFLMLGGFLAVVAERAFDVWWNSVENSSVSITPLVTKLAWPQGFWFAGMVFFMIVFFLIAARIAVALFQRDWTRIAQLVGPRGVEEEVEEEREHALAELARERAATEKARHARGGEC